MKPHRWRAPLAGVLLGVAVFSTAQAAGQRIGASFSADDNRVLVQDGSGVTLYDTSTGRPIRAIASAKILADRLAVDVLEGADLPDGQALSMQLLDLVHVRSPQQGDLRRVGYPPRGFAGDGDFSTVVLGSIQPLLTIAADSSVCFWSLRSRRRVRTIRDLRRYLYASYERGALSCIAFSGDGRYLATGGADIRWAQPPNNPQTGAPPTEAAYGHRKRPFVWWLRDGLLLHDLPGAAFGLDSPAAIAFSADGTRLVDCSGTGLIVWHLWPPRQLFR